MTKNRVKTILVSQPEPPSDKSPYTGLAKKHKVKIDFRPFVHVEGVDASEFRKQRVHILEHTAIIFTSRYAIDHFFRLCKETRVNVPENMKYFCMSEAVAYYLQNYIPFRKRKIFIGKLRFVDLMELISKHRQENFLLPVSDIYKDSMPKLLDDNRIKYTISVFYKTVASDLSDLTDITYDILVFFSPSGIASLFKNFPDFKQNDTQIAVFGKTTANSIKEHKLKLNITAPTPECPSMTMALDEYITEANKRKR